ncbi:hypothetical protein LGN06_29275 [Burkholderia vietnamiensis]|uniref:hypothetical protein n=1 Tax=Burkholderia vietnamiensis TaxID=60552 RepID=UPI001CF29C9A|nr:hypothetical protein [Burkholderia vietnamiensis]MCA8395639.1 hypothetical protein [Burkholderia vietnamiensis]HDR8961812.1 hypothetical protein [Burkholderia vietnamiensis]HDR9247902.1 hypothetical protein [Burkholderia vietnamiensis]
MKDDDRGNAILERWHAANAAHKAAKKDERDAAYAEMNAAEAAAADHFGIGKHLKAYNARFADDAS